MVRKNEFPRRNNGEPQGAQGQRNHNEQSRNREHVSNKEFRESRENREPRENRENREPREGQQNRYHNRENTPRQNYSSQNSLPRFNNRVKTEETVDDITADIARIIKEIELEIKEIKSMRLGL